jgi:hypothetical protein
MIKTYRLCGPALLAMTGAALAGEVPKFEELDRDGDGYITREEAAVIPGLWEHFSAFDRDGDGLLSRDEYAVVEGKLGRPDGEPY